MTVFQILGISFCALAIFFTVSARKRLNRRSAAIWSLLWMAAGLTIAFPQVTVVVARTLGISRGADLVFYCAILGVILGFFVVFVRLRRIQTSLTQIARRMAIEGARHPSEPSENSRENTP